MGKHTIKSTLQKSTSTGGIVGTSEMAKRIGEFDWAQTSLGPTTSWPQSLVTAVNILLQSPVPMVILWDIDGYMIYNDAYSIFAGKRHPRLLGSKVVDGWPEVADFNQNVMKQGLIGKTLSYDDQQLTLYRNNVPEEVWMNLNYSPVIDESGRPKGVLAIVVETTQRVLAERKQHLAEEELRIERERLQSLFSQAPALIAVLRGKKHVFEMANDLYVKTVAPGREVVGKTIIEAIPELKGQGVLKILDNVLKTGEAYVGEMQVQLDRFANGKLKDAYFNLVYQPISNRTDGKPDGIFVHAVEITDQVVSRRKAEQLSAQLQTVFDSLPDGLYIAEQGKITHLNQRGAEALGFATPNEVPRDLKDLYKQLIVQYKRGSGKRLSIKDSTLYQSLQGKSVQHIGVEVINPITGKKQILRTAGAPIRDTDGKIIGAVAINSDLTEMYDLQDKMQQAVIEQRLLTEKTRLLKEQNEQLTALNATKDEFIALTSHQLRTPATGVKQYVAMLIQGYAGPITATQKEYLERAYESNERQLLIIDDILRVARLDTGRTKVEKRPSDIVTLMQDILDEQSDRFHEHDLQLVTNFPSEPLKAPIDPVQLHMALGNIVDNAIKYTPAQKRVSVQIRYAKNASVVITISDQGVGIAEEDLQKLFLKFSRIPNPLSVAVGGTGLGLYWARRIIELHGGDVSVRSKLGQGTTFTITLPPQ